MWEVSSDESGRTWIFNSQAAAESFVYNQGVMSERFSITRGDGCYYYLDCKKYKEKCKKEKEIIFVRND